MTPDELVASATLAAAKAARTLGIVLDQDVAEDIARAALRAVREAAGVTAGNAAAAIQLEIDAGTLKDMDETDPDIAACQSAAAFLRALTEVGDA